MGRLFANKLDAQRFPSCLKRAKIPTVQFHNVKVLTDNWTIPGRLIVVGSFNEVGILKR